MRRNSASNSYLADFIAVLMALFFFISYMFTERQNDLLSGLFLIAFIILHNYI